MVYFVSNVRRSCRVPNPENGLISVAMKMPMSFVIAVALALGCRS